ncbi:MAG: hypothetical protein KDC98_20475, partial [Planctomycetes bacterium]|nr:hypothetical protein [Planctomycetota bacterium]
MRPLTLVISAVVHGGALGVAAAAGAFAPVAERRAPQVDVVALEARPEVVENEVSREMLTVTPEACEVVVELPPDPELPPGGVSADAWAEVVVIPEPARVEPRLSRQRV